MNSSSISPTSRKVVPETFSRYSKARPEGARCFSLVTLDSLDARIFQVVSVGSFLNGKLLIRTETSIDSYATEKRGVPPELFSLPVAEPEVDLFEMPCSVVTRDALQIHTKRCELANYCPYDVNQLHTQAHETLAHYKTEQPLLRSFIRHAGLPLRFPWTRN